MQPRLNQTKTGSNLLIKLNRGDYPAEAIDLMEGKMINKTILHFLRENAHWVFFRLGLNKTSMEDKGAMLEKDKNGTVKVDIPSLRSTENSGKTFRFKVGDAATHSNTGLVENGVLDLGELKSGNFILIVEEQRRGLTHLLPSRSEVGKKKSEDEGESSV